MVGMAILAKPMPNKDDCSWWIDSGASRHVCKERSLFKTFKEVDNGEVLYMKNDSMIKVLGIEQVELVFSSGKPLILRDVLYAPELRRNLVSGATLSRLGFKMVFEADKSLLYKGRGKQWCPLLKCLFYPPSFSKLQKECQNHNRH